MFNFDLLLSLQYLNLEFKAELKVNQTRKDGESNFPKLLQLPVVAYGFGDRWCCCHSTVHRVDHHNVHRAFAVQNHFP